jgi:4-amino-4-deoxy-L-arabinose transferase-like glycosyltransferase
MQDESISTSNPTIHNKDLIHWILVGLFIFLFSIFFFWKISDTPFHPDETTMIFMSSDVDLFLQNPDLLIWNSQIPVDTRMQYRLLDAPFARTWIGIFRVLGRVPELAADWNWSIGWNKNQLTGAYPTPIQITTGRLASAIFFPLDLLFLYLIGRKLRGNLMGWLLVLLFSLNALVLLHSRRAMSEGPLLFFIILSLWSFIQNPQFLFLTAIPVSLAFNAKYSALPLFFIGLFALIYRNYLLKNHKNRLIIQLSVYILIFLGITLLLNPFLWDEPFQALKAAIIARNTLLARQLADLGSISQGWISDTFGKRVGSIITNLYLTPPAFHDVGNYIENTISTELRYQAFFPQNLFRGYLWGSFMLVLSAMGFIFGFIHTLRFSRPRRELLLILVVGSTFQFIFLLWAFSIPFQRYVIPLIPYSIIWIAYAINELVDLLERKRLPH